MTVQTHDVRLIRFTAPASAKAGQTRPIVVGLFDGGYAELVRVDVFRVGAPNGDPFGSQVLVLEGRSGSRTAVLSFPYTFTKADASSKFVTFKAIVTLLDARDARPLDNQATARTRVTPR